MHTSQRFHRAVIATSLTILALSAALTACDTITEPDTALRPELALAQIDGADGQTYTRVEAPVPPAGERRVERTINWRGGVLALGDHFLIIPPGVIRQRARFSMEITDDGFLRFDLHALHEGGRRDRGGKRPVRFHGAVFLVVGYGAATNMTDVDLRRLTILYEPETGDAEPLHTVVAARGSLAFARLTHFSRYCLAYN